MVCRSCQSKDPALPVCGCGTIGAFPEGADAFSVLGLRPALAIDPEALRDRFLTLSKQVHPDRFVSAKAPDPTYSLRWSTEVNRAYQTLRDPWRRSEYLLEQAGLPLSTAKGAIPAELAELYFEMQDDDATDLAAIEAEIAKRSQANLTAWHDLAREWPPASQSDETFERATKKLRDILVARRYLQSMEHDIARRKNSGEFARRGD